MSDESLVERISGALKALHDKFVKVESRVLLIVESDKDHAQKILDQGEQIAKLIMDGEAKDKKIADTKQALSDLQAKFDTAIDATSLTSFTDSLNAMGKELDDTGLTADDTPISGLVTDPTTGDATLIINDLTFTPTPAAAPSVTDPAAGSMAPVVGDTAVVIDPSTVVSNVAIDPSSEPAPAPQVVEAKDGASGPNAETDPSVGLTTGASTVVHSDGTQQHV